MEYIPNGPRENSPAMELLLIPAVDTQEALKIYEKVLDEELGLSENYSLIKRPLYNLRHSRSYLEGNLLEIYKYLFENYAEKSSTPLEMIKYAAKEITDNGTNLKYDWMDMIKVVAAIRSQGYPEYDNVAKLSEYGRAEIMYIALLALLQSTVNPTLIIGKDENITRYITPYKGLTDASKINRKNVAAITKILINTFTVPHTFIKSPLIKPSPNAITLHLDEQSVTNNELIYKSFIAITHTDLTGKDAIKNVTLQFLPNTDIKPMFDALKIQTNIYHQQPIS